MSKVVFIEHKTIRKAGRFSRRLGRAASRKALCAKIKPPDRCNQAVSGFGAGYGSRTC
nr:MAG TPA: hypothetical protein [Caudoviricetes sp.]